MIRVRWTPVTDERRGIAKIPLHGDLGGYAIIDLRDLDKVSEMTWHHEIRTRPIDKTCSYAVATEWTGTDRRSVMLSRLITGAKDDDHVIHKNGDTLDNRRSNLHVGDKSDAEHTRTSRGGTSKYKGVWWDRHNSRWIGGFTVDGRKTTKRFSDEEEAAHWVDAQNRKHYGSLSSMNFPREGERSAQAQDDISGRTRR